MDAKAEMETFLRTLDRFNHETGNPSLEGLLLEKGTWFEGRADSGGYPEVKTWKAKFRPKVQECWYNAQALCVEMFGKGLEDVRYFEGYILIRPGQLPQEHGWAVMPDGRVVDVTMEAVEKAMAKKGIPTDTRGAVYLGLPLPIELVVLAQNGSTDCMPLAEEYFLGCKDDESQSKAQWPL